MKPEIRGLLFDKDGTLFDFKGSWGRWLKVQIEQLSGGNQAMAERLCTETGYNPRDNSFNPTSVVIAGTPGDIVEAMLPHLPQFDRQGLLEHLVETSAHAAQDEAVPLTPLLARFNAAGLKLGVATNDAEMAARAHLASAHIETAFDFISGSDSGYGSKPAPGMQNAFCDAVALRPEQVAMVGDSTHDLLAGKAAGMYRIAVLTGVADHDELAPHADVVLESIGDIPGFLGLPPE